MARTRRSKHRQAQRDAEYREVILGVAESMFAEHGFDGTRMQDIAGAAQMSLATLYGLYSGKLDLFGAVHAERGRQLLEAALPAATGDLDPLQRLLAGHRAYLRFLVEHPNYLKLHLQERSIWFERSTFRSEAQVSLWEQGIAALSLVFEQGAEAELLVDERPELMARMMVAIDQVRLGDWVASGMTEGVDALIERHQALLVRMFVRPT